MQSARYKATIKGLLLALGATTVVSCGSGDEAGGGGSCGGADETGVCLSVTLIAPVNLDAAFTHDVDVNFIPDCDLTTPALEVEPFTEHFADITFTASLVEGNPVNAAFVRVTNMTITYTLNPNTPFVGPAIATLTTGANVEVPVGTSVVQNLSLMNFQQKDDFTPLAGFNSSVPFTYPSYTVTYTFTGEDNFGRDVSASGSTEVTIGAYSNC